MRLIPAKGDGLAAAAAGVREQTQRVGFRRLKPAQMRITINRTNATPRTISQGSSALRPPAMAWLMILFGSTVVEVVESTGAR